MFRDRFDPAQLSIRIMQSYSNFAVGGSVSVNCHGRYVGLQEFFIPVANFATFARAMAKVLIERDVEALNVSIRHSPADAVSLLKWAPQGVFSFVRYYKQRNNKNASARVRAWTRELIDAALANGGRYYLPYRIDATAAQFERAYPEARAFATLKSRIDPKRRFTNSLWNEYLL